MRIWLAPLALLLILAPAARADFESVDDLLERFRALYSGMQATSGMEPDDINGVRAFADRVEAYAATQPDDPRPTAVHLQLMLWLEEALPDERKALQATTLAAFDRLLEQRPDDPGLAIAAFCYRRDSGLIKRDERKATQDALIARFPDHPDTAAIQAESYRDEEMYPEVIEILEPIENIIENRRIARLLAEAYFAEHRFDEALEIIDGLRSNLLGRMDFQERVRLDQVRENFADAQTAYNVEVPKWEAEAEKDDLPRVEIYTDKGVILVELYEDDAPNHVANFISLCEDGFYEGTKFHRYEPNGWISGGCPNTKEGAGGEVGRGDAGYTIADEGTPRRHLSGTLNFEKRGPDTSSSRFSILMMPYPSRDRGFTAFGRVIDGLAVARSLREEDEIQRTVVVRKRDHDYTPVPRMPDGADGPEAPAEEPAAPAAEGTEGG